MTNLATLLDQRTAWLQQTAAAAAQAHHAFPEYAACEAALESGYGTSKLATEGNNLFGMKQHLHPEYGTLNFPTKEFLHGQWEETEAGFVSYPDPASCFADRMATLVRLAGEYPHYSAALAARDGATFVNEVSQTWSSDPERAQKVLAIYQEYAQACQWELPGCAS